MNAPPRSIKSHRGLFDAGKKQQLAQLVFLVVLKTDTTMANSMKEV
jgi:hypothetical protein